MKVKFEIMRMDIAVLSNPFINWYYDWKFHDRTSPENMPRNTGDGLNYGQWGLVETLLKKSNEETKQPKVYNYNERADQKS